MEGVVAFSQEYIDVLNEVGRKLFSADLIQTLLRCEIYNVS